MDAKAKKFLLELLKTPSPVGFETEGQKCWLKYAKTFADEVHNDAYGNGWAVLKGTDPKAPTLMLEAHVDEIGFIVRKIQDDGFIRIGILGGSDAACARGKRVQILGDKGTVIGIIGNTAIHLRKDKLNGEKAPKIHELYVDIGAKNPAEVAKMGIRVGSPMVYVDEPMYMGPKNEYLVCRALDNRVGGFAIAQVMRELAALPKAKRPKSTLIIANCTQEEIGGYGAKMTSFRLEPDACICIDVGLSTDHPGVPEEAQNNLGLNNGPMVQHARANHPLVVKRLMEVAKKNKIPLQHEVAGRFGGTDTDQIFFQKQGIPCGLVSVPLRYMHSTVEMISLKDMEGAVALMKGFVQSVKPSDTFHHKLV